MRRVFLRGIAAPRSWGDVHELPARPTAGSSAAGLRSAGAWPARVWSRPVRPAGAWPARIWSGPIRPAVAAAARSRRIRPAGLWPAPAQEQDRPRRGHRQCRRRARRARRHRFRGPGFFLSDDGGGSEQTASAKSTAESLVTAIGSRDADALNKLSCQDITPGARDLIEDVAEVGTAQLSGQVQESGDRATAPFAASHKNAPDITADFVAVLAKQNGSWCWQDLQYPEDLGG